MRRGDVLVRERLTRGHKGDLHRAFGDVAWRTNLLLELGINSSPRTDIQSMRALRARAVPTVRCQRPELAETGRAEVMYLCLSYSTVVVFLYSVLFMGQRNGVRVRESV